MTEYQQVPPGLLKLQRVIRDTQRQREQISKALAVRAKVPRHPAPSLALRLGALQKRLRVQWERALPDNWSGKNADDVKNVVELMDETGWSLVWVPSLDTLDRLLASQTREPERRLIRFEKRILPDLESCLRELSSPPVRELRGAIRGAIATHKAGHYEAAQALAGSVLTATVHQFFEPSTLGGVRKKGADISPDEVALRRYRRAIVFQRVAEALEIFVPGEDPIPTRFNRHAVVHTVAPEQFTHANSLAGLMLTTSIVREIEHEIRERDELGEPGPGGLEDNG